MSSISRRWGLAGWGALLVVACGDGSAGDLFSQDAGLFELPARGGRSGLGGRAGRAGSGGSGGTAGRGSAGNGAGGGETDAGADGGGRVGEAGPSCEPDPTCDDEN